MTVATLMNRDLLLNDPARQIPNQGVSKVGRPATGAEWDVLRFELDTFVSEGEYARGLERILGAFLANQGQSDQPGAWVSGFYGSGKSHFARVLAALWTDLQLPDGTRARGLVHRLSSDIEAHLAELSTRGRQSGGLWSASGTLSSGARSFRMAVLDILFQAAGLPDQYGPGMFVLWLRRKGFEQPVREALAAVGLQLEREAREMNVSTDLAEALIALDPGFGPSPDAVNERLHAQFGPRDDISDSELIVIARDILASVSTDPNPDWSRRKLPATLLVLDEVQQYIGDQSDRSLEVQTTVERLQSELDGQVMVVGTGQAALQSTPNLQKLIARFKIPVQLRSNDVDEVVRKVILEKRPAHVPALHQFLDEKSGEIDRHLQGTNIGARADDHKYLVADYPLLPARRRFWGAVLRAVDQTGAGGQLRSQLQLTHEATAKIADAPLGVMIPGDAIFDRLRDSMLQSGTLLSEIDEVIQAQRDAGRTDGTMRARVLALVFLINQLPPGGISDTGLQATPGSIADLLVDDLSQSSGRLREEVSRVLHDLADEGLLMAVDGQYRLQTREGQEWDADFRARQTRIRNDDARIASDRADELKKALTARLKGLSVLQGATKEKRDYAPHFGAEPPPQTGAIPVWVRDEWTVTDRTVRQDAQREGMDSPIVHLFLPRRNAEELRAALAGFGAAEETLATRPVPTSPEGIEARSGMESRRQQERARLDGLLSEILDHARVYQGGGTEVAEATLNESMQRAMEASALRLFPRFADADRKGWDKVVDRAVQGNPNPLEVLDYQGEAAANPVTREIADFLKTPRSGQQLRKRFGDPPYGWPQDAIDGGLLALIADGKVRASLNGKPRLIQELKRPQVGQTEFVLEDSPPETTHKLALRRLAATILGPQATGDDARLAQLLLDRLSELAQRSGGPPPLPAPPQPELLEQVRLTQGGRRVIEIAANKSQLEAWFEDWSALAKKAPERMARWERLERLLRAARDLPQHDDIAAQVAAIRDNRLLLQEPDPTEAPIDRLVEGLRAAIRTAREELVEARAREVAALEATPEWSALDDGQWKAILATHELGPVPEIDVGDDQAILAGLERRPLSTWADRTAALPARAAAAHAEAAKRTQPEAGEVRPKMATLTTAAEVDGYLADLRAEIMALIEAGRSVIVTR